MPIARHGFFQGSLLIMTAWCAGLFYQSESACSGVMPLAFAAIS